MLHQLPKRPFQLPQHSLSSLHSLTPPTPTIPNSPTTDTQTHEHNNNYYKPTCDLILSLTRSRSLPKGLQVHAHVIKSGIHSIPLVSHNLINFYTKTRLPCRARQVFDETTVRSSTTWSSVIACFAQNELPLTAIEYFRRMLVEGLRPDDHIYPSAAKAVAVLGSADAGRSLHGHVIKTGYVSDVFVGSSVVDMYGKCGEVSYARKVFDEMPERNVVSWTGMISGYVQVGDRDEEALRLFKRALGEGVEVNDFTLSSVARGCGNSTLLELGRQVHGLCFKVSFDSSSFVGTSLVSLYARCGVVEEACQVFDEVVNKNLGLWNAMLVAYAQHARADKAFVVFERMTSLGTKPNFITFLGLLYACSHSGSIEKGKLYFELMKEYGIEPEAQHYASMVDMLCRAGKLHEAVSVVEEMPIKPTEYVWGALLTGCRTHGDAELAGSVADKVSDWTKMGPGLHVLLSNAYAAAGRWDEAARVRKAMRDQGTRKTTGLSWVEDGNKVHSFASGDRTHPRTDEIYAKLEELGEEMERAGYVPDTSFVLKRVDGEEKSERIRYHSERLAIAFGLIAFPAERPIRVMKNVRVCGDCHNAIKFMSKCSGRVIVLRDYNLFHRFADGKCSCGDYW